MLRFKVLLAGLMGAAMLIAAPAFADGRYGKQKVVYHVNYDNPKKQAGALRNIQNHINAVGKENIDVRVVMHGNGLSLILLPEALEQLKKFKQANASEVMTAKIDGLKGQGVKFNVCANTVRGRKVDLLRDTHDVEKADIVPSGVAELSHLQQQGFTYIRP
jgi:intracellular sulfur oxidation DsrE/DsrF family protein